MREVTGPIVATALVLCAVFVPTAFISGLTGEFYQAVRPDDRHQHGDLGVQLADACRRRWRHCCSSRTTRRRIGCTRILNRALGWFFRPFNRCFARASHGYVRGVARVLRAGGIVLLVYGGLIALTWLGFARTPSGFVPAQDKQYLVAFAQLPDAATLDRTEEVIRRMGARR